MVNLERIHPLFSFLYFLFVIGITMSIYNPIIILTSATSGLFYIYYTEKTLRGIFYFIPLMFFIAVLNPIFSHKGMTILFYFGNPITLESILFGVCSGLMVFSVMVWCKILSKILSDDKIVYLFGKFMPKGSLILSMTFRLIPNIKRHFQSVLQAQNGFLEEKKSFILKIKLYSRVISATMTWLFEKAIITSDSMSAREYGKKKRSNYNIFEFTKRDNITFCVIFILFSFILFGLLKDYLEFRFYPKIYFKGFKEGLIFYVLFSILVFMPFILEVYEVRKWEYLKSKN